MPIMAYPQQPRHGIAHTLLHVNAMLIRAALCPSTAPRALVRFSESFAGNLFHHTTATPTTYVILNEQIDDVVT